MKKLLLLPLMFIATSVFAGDTSIELLKTPRTYMVDIKNSNNETVFQTDLNYNSNRNASASKTTYYAKCDDNFVVNGMIDTGANVSMYQDADGHQWMNLTLSDLVSLENVASTCGDIVQEPNIFEYTERFNLPIISYQNKVWKDATKQDFYIITINTRKN